MISALTNLAYVFAGLMLGGVYGLSLCALGVASFGFHAGLGWKWQAADECGMYVALCCLAVLWGVPPVIGYMVALALVAAWGKVDSFVAVPFLVVFNVLLIGVHSPGKGAMLALIGAVAFGIRQWAERRGGNTEDYGHGAWHILTAIALYAAMP